MDITWKTTRRGGYTNYVAIVDEQRVVVMRPTQDADYIVAIDSIDQPGTYPTAAAARKAAAALLEPAPAGLVDTAVEDVKVGDVVQFTASERVTISKTENRGGFTVLTFPTVAPWGETIGEWVAEAGTRVKVAAPKFSVGDTVKVRADFSPVLTDVLFTVASITPAASSGLDDDMLELRMVDDPRRGRNSYAADLVLVCKPFAKGDKIRVMVGSHTVTATVTTASDAEGNMEIRYRLGDRTIYLPVNAADFQAA